MKKTSKILLLIIITTVMSFMLFSNSVFADTELITASTGDEDVVDLDAIDTENKNTNEEENKTTNETKDKNENKAVNKTSTDKNEAEENVPQTGSFNTVTYITIGGVAILTLTIAATRIKKYNF